VLETGLGCCLCVRSLATGLEFDLIADQVHPRSSIFVSIDDESKAHMQLPISH